MDSSTTGRTQNDGFAIVWKSILAYLIWFLIRNAFTKLSFLRPIWEKTNDLLAELYVSLSAKTLMLLGYELNYNSRNLLMGTNQEMYVGNHCLGIASTSIFLLIILLLNGNVKRKILFFFTGFFVIFLANWFRIVGLALMLKLSSPAFFQFNHKYTYLVLVYGIIFLMILLFDRAPAKK